MSEAIASSAPPPPQTEEELQEELQKKLQIQVVDTSDAVQSEAVDRAERYLSREATQGGMGGFLKRIWQGNIARDFYRQREIQRGRREIVETGNIYINSAGEQADHDQAMGAVVERFASDFVHEGENNQSFEDVEHGQGLMDQLRELVSTYAHSGMPYEALIEERTRILSEFGHQVHQEDRNRGLIYADNILEVAANARAAFEHGTGLDRIDAAIHGKIGEARTGVRTEARLEVTDRALDWMHSHHMSGVNEVTLALGVATAMTVSKFTTRKIVTAGAAFVGLGVGAGVIAAGREYLRIGQERTTHSRQIAEGGEIQDNSRRREQMEETRYETVSVAELTSELQSALQALEGGSTESLDELIATATAARARIHASDVHSIDLLEYSGKTAVESERLALDIELARATVAIQEAVEVSDQPVDLAALQQNIHELITQDISAKDRAFNRLRRNRTIKMGLIGAATGMLAGLGIQEIHALLDGGLQGVTETIGGSNRHSLLADIFNHHSHSTSDNQHREFFEGGHHFHDVANDLPPGYHLVESRPGDKFGWEIQGPDGKNVLDKLNLHGVFNADDHNSNHIHHLSEGHLGVGYDTQGNLDHDTRMALREVGFNLTQHQINFHEPHLVTSSMERSPQEFLAHHQGDFTHVLRELWYDNNTPRVYDHNELKLWWGGATGSGIDSHGDYVLNVSHMSPDGSYHDGLSANAQQLIHDGKMKLALSMTKDTQSHVFMVNVDSNGNAVIPHGSFIAHSLFESQNGQAHFIGAYAEADQILGTNPDGSENVRMLATVVGDNNPHTANDIVHHMVSKEHTHYVTNIEAPQETPIEIPPVLPVYSRRGLEELTPAELERERQDYYGYNREPSQEQKRRWSDDMSPRLHDNSEATLNPGEELSWYRHHLEDRRGTEYVKEVDSYIQNDEVLASLDDSVDVVVSMPVAAVNEADNIYATLSLYAQQSENAKRRTVALLHVNWPETATSDPDKQAAINKTIAEIERAKADFPELKIASFQKQWSEEFMRERKNVLYGEVVKVLYDTAMLAVERSIREERRTNREALLITNDADAIGLRRNYLDVYLDALKKYPESDAYTGLIRFDTRTHQDYPGFGISTNIMMLLSMASGRRGKGYTASPSTPGANSGFRMSSLAAIGGPDDTPNMGAGADTILGRKLRYARERGEDISGGIAYDGRTASATPTSVGASDSATNARRAVIKHLYGAQLDTNGDRFLGVYRQGRLVGSSWRDYDLGGYRDRREELSGLLADQKENPADDIDSIATRIEGEVSFLGTEWHSNPALMSWTLGTYFGTQDSKGRQLYTLDWNKGSLRFKFTNAGKVWLRNRLTRDTRGRFDSYGSRVRRRLYSEVSPDSRRSIPPGIRFVGAQAS